MSERTSTPNETGYAEVNGLRMYYEIHGGGDGTPLLLLHGGLFNIDLQFGHVLPGLAAGRRVVATDLQGHGRTHDLDRSLAAENLASDVVGLLAHLGLGRVDVYGFSLGGAAALHLAVRHPEVVRKVVLGSIAFNAEGQRQENVVEVGRMTVDMIAGTPMEQDYRAKAPDPDGLQGLLDKIGDLLATNEGFTDDEIRGIEAPTLLTVGDCDMVPLSHAVRFLQLRGGDVNGDFVGVPPSQLAVFPGTTHFNGMARADLVVPVVTTFLDTDPAPAMVPAAVE